MTLTPGTRLGPYEIVAPIGAGGMGEVYRAKDTKLNRDVAIKVLPESFALDADRVARFTREAQVLASLNHPNIAAIYGIEEKRPGLISGATQAEMSPGPALRTSPTADGLRFLMQEPPEKMPAWLGLIEHWTGEVSRRIPTGRRAP
jgi:hypothetical protein